MPDVHNRQIVLAKRPTGTPDASCFSVVTAELREPGEGELLIKTLYISVDPYMRGRMNDVKSYVPPFRLNEVIEAGAVGEVITSRHPRFKPGDVVTGMLGWQLYALSDGSGLQGVDTAAAPVTTSLGLLGLTGLTAYFGLLDIGKPVAGETVVISGAAGAVGSVAGQIAKLLGCRVVGIAGSDDKTRYLVDELGFDAAINYRTEDLGRALRIACPNGMDVYFDNVGGDVSDAVLLQMNDCARIVLCGQISMYNLNQPDIGPRLLGWLVVHRALMQGFIVTDYAPRFAEGAAQLATWLQEGKLVNQEHIVQGFDHIVDAFLGLFQGDNTGKQLVQVADARDLHSAQV